MAPLSKRSRRAADDGDDEIIGVTAASANLRRDSRKRARLSSTSEQAVKQRSHRQQRSSSVSDARETPPAEGHERVPFLSTQYEIDRDAGFAHLNHADLDDERATQKLLSRTKLIGDNHASENAIIESVTMVNFMCHERLHVELGPLINFIVGENGSGKSAILTALTLCLGGKASTTNRGGSMKSFIKEGREQGSLIINLKNQGLDAYQPDVYGDTIIVERYFSKSGSSGFKLKNSAGRIISTKKAEVEELIEYYQMQIDNPMTVLSQDNARQFLNSATPSQKYKFFVKGVQLEQLDNDYKLLQETYDAMSIKLDVGKAHSKALEQTAQAAKDKMELVKQHKGLRDQLKMLTRQSAWAQVAEQERDLQQKGAVVGETQAKVEELEKWVQMKNEEYEQTHVTFERAVEAINRLQTELDPLREEQAAAKTAHDMANQDVATAHQEQRDIREQLSAADNRMKKIQREIDEEQRRLEDVNGGAHARKLVDFDAAEKSAANAKARLNDSAFEGPQIQDAHQAATEELQKSGMPIDKKKKELAACESQLQHLRRDVGSVMAGFDSRMSKLLYMIRDDNGFKEKPVGPMGLHIKLLKPIWSNVLEKSIGNLLSGFVVTSKQDQIRLSDILRRLGIDKSPVIIGNHHPLDTRGHEPDDQYDTVLRVLDIDSELVKRQLIITQGIEQTILVEKHADALRIMYDGGRPQNVKQCFCLHNDRRGWGIRLGFMANSSDPASSPIPALTGRKPRMKTDLDSQISYQQETLHHLRGEINSLQLHQRELQQVLQKRAQAVQQHKRTEKQLQLQLQRADEEVDRLQEELDGDNIKDGKLEALKEELQEAQVTKAISGGSYGDSGVQKEKLNAICLSHKRTLDAVKARMKAHEDGISKAEKKTLRIRQARQIALHEKNLAIERLNDANFAKEAADQRFNKQQERVEEFNQGASQVCARVPVNLDDTPAKIEIKMQKFSKQIAEYNRRAGGTDEEICRKYETAAEAYKYHATSLKRVSQLHGLLQQTIGNRLEMWRRFQRYISARSRSNFTYLLSERGFRGKLLVDHKNKLLDIQVEPDETLESAEGRNTKTLSGGEKSFSNICLLLSVWEAMAAPLRCLDEFDVFMDNVNRDVSTTMIIQAARRSVGRQFILITPNAIGGNVKQGPDVKITRLTDPRQRQLELERV